MGAAATLDPAVRTSPASLVREPLAWAALAAFVGSAVGLVGTFSWAAREGLALWAGPAGGLLAALSLLGVAPLLGRRSWAAWAGVVLLLVWLVASLAFILYSSLRPPGPSGAPPFAFLVLVHASFWGGSAAVLPFALGAFFGARKRWLGAVLLALSVPGMLLVLLYVPPAGADVSLLEIAALVGPLSFPGVGVGVPEAVLWVSLGVMLLGEARQRALSKVWRGVAEENRRKAQRLYEEGLGRGDLSVVDELVSEDFRDLRHGGHGKQGMRRILLALRESFPDLAVSVEDQEAQGDLVSTRLLLSGTDRGGVSWFPATGRRAAFCATFEDRFRGGELVEHGGSTDTESLLRQLDLPVEDG
jgi:predicted ester cyclase